MTIEIGPVAHSTINAKIYEQAKTLLFHALDYVELHNQYIEQQQKPGSPQRIQLRTVKLPVAERVAQVDYPLDEAGRICAFVHPQVQGMNELKPGSTVQHGSPIFQALDGTPILLDAGTQPTLSGQPLNKAEPLYPIFVNEAAYRESNIAFFLTRIVERDVAILVDSGRPSKL
jgi:hypothetical protein